MRRSAKQGFEQYQNLKKKKKVKSLFEIEECRLTNVGIKRRGKGRKCKNKFPKLKSTGGNSLTSPPWKC